MSETQADSEDLRLPILKGLVIDVVIIWIVLIVVGAIISSVVGYSISDDGPVSFPVAILNLVGLFAWWMAYFILFERVLKTTPRLLAYGLQVRKANDVNAGRRLAAVVISVAETFPFPILSLIWTWFEVVDARLSDRLRDTKIVKVSRQQPS